MNEPTIPPHLLRFDPDNWPGRTGPPPLFTTSPGDELVKREQQRQAQDAWSTRHRLGRAEFEQLRDRQRQATT